MPLEEQQERFAQYLTEQGLFEFLLRPAIREGEVSRAAVPITLANLDRDVETGEYQFPNYERVARLRRALESQAGIPAAAILKELDAPLPVQEATQENRRSRLQELPHREEEPVTLVPQLAHRHQQRRRKIS
jgi:hypothetical protein